MITLKGQVTDYHIKYHDEIKARKDDASKARSTLDQFQTEAKQAHELLESEKSKLQAKVDELEAAAKKREGDAYSLGFSTIFATSWLQTQSTTGHHISPLLLQPLCPNSKRITLLKSLRRELF